MKDGSKAANERSRVMQCRAVSVQYCDLGIVQVLTKKLILIKGVEEWKAIFVHHD